MVEYFLTICGDPDVGLDYLVDLLEQLEARNFDTRRQRAGARFDSSKGPLYFGGDDADDDEADSADEGTPASSGSQARSQFRSRSSRRSRSRPAPRAAAPSTPGTAAPAAPPPPKEEEEDSQRGAASPEQQEDVDYSPDADYQAASSGTARPAPPDTFDDSASCESWTPDTPWACFYHTVQNALVDSRSTLGWSTSPASLTDTICSVAKMEVRHTGAPPATQDPWPAEQDLRMVLFCVTSAKEAPS